MTSKREISDARIAAAAGTLYGVLDETTAPGGALFRELKSALDAPAIPDVPVRVRMQYAGAIGLLCELSTKITDDEDKDCLDSCVADWCELTGWRWRRVLDRVEVFPPPEPA